MITFNQDTTVEESKELVGFGVLPTGAYKGTVEQAYLISKPSKTEGVSNIYFVSKIKLESGQTVKFEDFVGKNTATGMIYYSEKEGKKTEYPSFSAMNRMLTTLCGKTIFTTTNVEKPTPVYNYATKQDEVMPVTRVTDVEGKQGIFGIQEVHENGYKDPTKLVKSNTLVKAWRIVNGIGLSVKEIEAGLTTPKDLEHWLSLNKDKPNTRNLDAEKLSNATAGATANTASTAELIIG